MPGFRVLLALIAAVALAAPAAPALAQSSPFAPLPQNQGLPEPAPETTGSDTDENEGEGGLEGWQELALLIGGGILLVGIGWAIVRDARTKAPVADRRALDPLAADGKPRDPHAPRKKARARSKAKAARAARKTNVRRNVKKR